MHTYMHTYIGVDPIVTGDVFQVSLFESDTEDDSSADSRVLISLSDRFFQELTFNGDVSFKLIYLLCTMYVHC